MIELLPALTLAAAEMLNVGIPANLPQIIMVDADKMRASLCQVVEKCPALIVFSDLNGNTLYVAKHSDKATLAVQAALFREAARFVMFRNRYYTYNNSCEVNEKMERGFERLELQFIANVTGKQPDVSVMSNHVFMCDQKKTPKPKMIWV